MAPPTSPALRLFLVLLWQLAPSPQAQAQAQALPPCTEYWQRAQGYTFTLDPGTGERVWSFCQFPDPRHDHAHCGLPEWPQPAFLCDPDRLIGSDQAGEGVCLSSVLFWLSVCLSTYPVIYPAIWLSPRPLPLLPAPVAPAAGFLCDPIKLVRVGLCRQGVFLSACLSVCLPVCLSVCLSVCLPARLSKNKTL